MPVQTLLSSRDYYKTWPALSTRETKTTSIATMKNVSWFGMGGAGGGRGSSSSTRRLAAVTEESSSSSTTGSGTRTSGRSSPPSSSSGQHRPQKMTKRTLSLSSLRGGGGGNGNDGKDDSTSTVSTDEDVLELYRGEIEDLRRQLKESQEARVREEEKEMEIVRLRRQLEEARREKVSAPAASTRTSASSTRHQQRQRQRQLQQQQQKDKDAEAVASAIRYLDEVIRRVSKSSPPKGNKSRKKQGSASTAGKGSIPNDNDATPVKTNRKFVQLEFCPTLNQSLVPPLGEARRTVTPPPPLAASDGDAEEHDDDDDDSGSWQAAGAIRELVEEDMTASSSSVATSSLHTAADGMSSMLSDASSWQPAGAIAALIATSSAADDSTVNTTSNDTWMTAADDDFDDDMQTCISALTAHTGGVRSRGASSRTTATGATSRADDSAVVVAELCRIQSLLQTVLREKVGAGGDAGEGSDDKVDASGKDRPGIQRVSSRAKKIATLWERHLNKDDEEAEEEEKDEPTKTTAEKKQGNMEPAALTKAKAEEIITSLAGLF